MGSIAAIAANEVPPKANAPVASALHTVGLLLIIAGGASLTYLTVGSIQGGKPPSRVPFYLSTMAWEWLLFAYVIFGVQRNRTPLQEVLGPKWRGAKELARDIGIALAFWAAALMILGIVAHLLQIRSMEQNVRFLGPQGPLESALWILTALTAGICEETVFRGYLQKQLIAWTGTVALGVIFSGILFGAAHIYQGGRRVVVIAVYGVLFGILAQVRRSVRPGMITHAVQDTVSGFAMRFLAG